MKNFVLSLASLALLAPIAVMPNIHENRVNPDYRFRPAHETEAHAEASIRETERLFVQYDLYYSLYPNAK